MARADKYLTGNLLFLRILCGFVVKELFGYLYPITKLAKLRDKVKADGSTTKTA